MDKVYMKHNDNKREDFGEDMRVLIYFKIDSGYN